MSPCSPQTLIVQITGANAVFWVRVVSNKPLRGNTQHKAEEIMITLTKQKKLGYNSMGFNIAAMGLFSWGIRLFLKNFSENSFQKVL